ncbi:MAG: Stp1/IreP family PP2C-type Ser/Thr phosphatase, partial [Anaerolineae bacterium]
PLLPSLLIFIAAAIVVIGIIGGAALILMSRKAPVAEEPLPSIPFGKPEAGWELAEEALELVGLETLLPSLWDVPPLKKPHLRSLDRRGEQIFYPLDKDIVRIGRSSDNDLIIDENYSGWETVSRRHAEIHRTGKRFILVDLGSLNGVYVNGQRTGRNLLREGFQVGIGKVNFIFTIGEEQETAILAASPARPSSALPEGEGDAINSPERGRKKPVAQVGQEDETIPFEALPPASAPLPEGALLGGERYIVLHKDSSTSELNIYLAESAQPLLHCPNPACGMQVEKLRARTCPWCGASLADAKRSYLRFLMKESFAPEPLATERELFTRRLRHPGLLLPQDYFEEIPYGEEKRYYLALPGEGFIPAAHLPLPQESWHVLAWGVALSEALSYLHERGIAHRQIDLGHILFVGEEPKLADFSAARLAPPDSTLDRAECDQDIQMLARALHLLLTGSTEITPPGSLHPLVAATFGRALASALEDRYRSASELARDMESALRTISRPAAIFLRSACLTDVGLIRRLNEDSLLILERTQAFKSESRSVGLYAIADGMGGHSAGEVASSLAISALESKAVKYMAKVEKMAQDEWAISTWLEEAFNQASQAVFERRMAARTDMGTTLVSALVIGDTAYIANVGDSRAYLFTARGMEQITTDHSLVERLVEIGQISAEEARTYPHRNVIYNVIGNRPEAEADIFIRRLQPGDMLLLCSDGLSGMVQDKEMESILRTSSEPYEACRRLVEAANFHGGEDNITVIIVQLMEVRTSE